MSIVIDHVKVLIERCIQNYMSLEQTMAHLHENHKIDQFITKTIWEYLQRDNQDFFKEFYKRCELIRQIVRFNELLAQQNDLMQKIREINLSVTAPVVTQLHEPNHDYHQDQLYYHQVHDLQEQRIECNYLANTANSVSSLIGPFASTQSDASILDLPYDTGSENLSERFYYPQEQSTSFQVQEEPPNSDASNSTILDFGYEFNNNNNGSNPTYYGL